MSRRLRAFIRWMRSQGIDCSNALQLIDGEDGIAVRALCDLNEGDLVATIPVSACLTTKTSAAREMIEEAGLAGSLGLSVAVMYERSLGPASVWDGYLQLLPEKECVPLVWSLEEVDTLLLGTELHKTVKEDKSLLYDDWKECIEPLIASGHWKLKPTSFGVEQYFAAKSLVASRSFEIDDYHGFGMVLLADLFNHKTGAENVHFFSNSSHSGSDTDDDTENGDKYQNIDDDKQSIENHDLDLSGCISNHVDSKRSRSSTVESRKDFLDAGKAYGVLNTVDEPAALEMGIVKDVKAGNEVFNTYGSMGNAALLHRYGFTELGNPFDIVNIDLNLVIQWISKSFTSRYCRSRLSLWRRLGCSGCVSQNAEYFEISSDGEPQLELLILLCVVFLPGGAYNKLDYTVQSVGNVDISKSILLLSKECRSLMKTREKNDFLLTSSVRRALKSLADIRESFYGPNSMEDDMNALKKCCCSNERKLYHSLVLRVSERTILKKLRLYAYRSCKKRKRAMRS